jgi:hypothetical protein
MEKNSNHGSEPVGKMQRETEVIFQVLCYIGFICPSNAMIF